MNKFHYFSIALAASLLLSCSGNKQDTQAAEEQDPRVDREMTRTSQDTMQLKQLATQYLDYLKARDFDSALGMIKLCDNGDIIELPDSAAQSLRVVYNTYPVVDYHIDDIKLYGEEDTEIEYRVVLFEKTDPNDDRPNTMRFILTPKRIAGQWTLCIDNRFIVR